MRELVYQGPGGARRFGVADGLTTDVEFLVGEPTEISDENARRILAGPHKGEFAEADPADDDEPDTDGQAKTAGPKHEEA